MLYVGLYGFACIFINTEGIITKSHKLITSQHTWNSDFCTIFLISNRHNLVKLYVHSVPIIQNLMPLSV